ncbi:hypothetical protein EJ08DRAFT_733849 [Tothia fuscella]|uniref:MARVEL domain-containing protein n=1 Tax=Tothia fuscella TaxID=1048955 RepID=A0A9P4NSZ8_9PEZI|nr:hypothetical protein EJ08DRAFT_733849 [Tothia fuscella]
MAFTTQFDYHIGGLIGTYIKTFIRCLQILLGLIIIGIYASDLGAGISHGASPHPHWTYAVVVGTLSVITAAVYLIPFVPAYFMFGWDFILVVLHAALVGVFGRDYVHPKMGEVAPEGTVHPDVRRMHNTVFVDVVSGILWLITGSMGMLVFFRVRRWGRQDVESQTKLPLTMTQILAPWRK